jgi:pyruvate dehydrogenase (quinone)
VLKIDCQALITPQSPQERLPLSLPRRSARSYMLMCEFLTAVHHKLPVKMVIYNNSAFGLIPLEAEAAGLPPFRQGIELPNPDFAALARACGGHGFAARSPGELKAAVSEAVDIDGSGIVDSAAPSS